MAKKYKIGDIVIVKELSNLIYSVAKNYNNKIGVIIHVYDRNYDYVISINNIEDSIAVYENEIQLLTSEQEKTVKVLYDKNKN